MQFYEKYLELCNSVGKSPSKVVLENGLKKSAVTRWKAGGSPTDATLQKIADYFGVPMQYFSDETKKPTPEGEPNKSALLAAVDTMSREELIQMLNKISQRLTEV